MDSAVHSGMAQFFGGLALLIIAARLGGHVAARLKLPTVLGELGAGLALGIVPWSGRAVLREHPAIGACAEFGVVLLLFEIGLESDLTEIGRVGPRATIVAILGVAAPVVLGALVSALFNTESSVYSHAFVGATLA